MHESYEEYTAFGQGLCTHGTTLLVVRAASLYAPVVVQSSCGSYEFVMMNTLYTSIHLGCVPDDIHNPFEGTTHSPVDVSLALYGVLWAYDGWCVT